MRIESNGSQPCRATAVIAMIFVLIDAAFTFGCRNSERPLATHDRKQRLRGPDKMEKLGTVPRSLAEITVSNDLRRAAVVTSAFHGDS